MGEANVWGKGERDTEEMRCNYYSYYSTLCRVYCIYALFKYWLSQTILDGNRELMKCGQKALIRKPHGPWYVFSPQFVIIRPWVTSWEGFHLYGRWYDWSYRLILMSVTPNNTREVHRQCVIRLQAPSSTFISTRRPAVQLWRGASQWWGHQKRSKVTIQQYYRALFFFSFSFWIYSHLSFRV